MKTIKITLATCLVAISTALIWTACQKEDLGSTVQENTIEKKNDITSGDNSAIWLPTGTKERTTGSRLSFETPEGWSYIFKDRDGEIGTIAGGGGDIECNCVGENTEGDCKPATVSGKGRRCISSCELCKLTEFNVVGNLLTNIEEGGFVNIGKGVTFAKRGENLALFFESMLEIDEIRQGIEDFVKNLHKGNPIPEPLIENGTIKAPEGYTFAIVNAFGRGAAILVPEDVIQNRADMTGSTVGCVCLDKTGEGEGECKVVSIRGLVVCLNSGCKTCGLDVAITPAGKKPKTEQSNIVIERFRL